MKKRLLNLFLALVLVACVLPMAASAAGRCEHEDIGTTTVAKAEAEAATCTEAGYEAYYYCTVCEKVMKLEGTGYVETTKTVIPASHTWQRKAAFAATCTTDGWNGGDVCKVCDAPRNESNVIPATGHDYEVENETPATCTQSGMKRSVCKTCGTTRFDYPAKLAHTSENVDAVPATCTTAGQTAGTQCSVCKARLTGMETVEPIPHNFNDGPLVEWIKKPTCEEDGSAYYECASEGCIARETRAVAKRNCNIVELDAVAPTCTETGLTAGTKCDSCNNGENCAYCAEHLVAQEVVATVAHAYVYLKDVEGQEPTCTQVGRVWYVCGTCNGWEMRDGTLKAHEPEEIAAVPATCEGTGLTVGSKCANCETILEEPEEVSALGHSYAYLKDVEGQEPTCSQAGKAWYVCGTCDNWEMRDAAVKPHEPVEIPAVAATCTTKAKTVGEQCKVCYRVLTEPQETGEPLGHAYTFLKYVEDKEPTCTEASKEWHVCGRCNDWQMRDAAAIGHKYEFLKHVEGQEPTCTQDGKSWYVCENCDDWKMEDTEAFGHDEVEVERWEPTCTKDGIVETSCNRCNVMVRERIDALGHTEVILPVVPATCTATGLGEGKKCSVCGEVLTEQEVISMLAHTWKTVTAVEPTCTTDGHNAYQECEVCHTTQNKEVIDGGHNFVNYICTECGVRDGSCEHEGAEINVVNSTCTTAGSESFRCGLCGYEYVETLPLAAHQEVDQSVAATCTQKGKTHKVCGVCGQDTMGPVEIPTIAHNNVNGSCSVCGLSLCSHSQKSTQTHASTCTERGYVIETCNSCGKVSTRELPLAAHKHVNGICSACGHIDENRITSDFQDIFVVG